MFDRDRADRRRCGGVSADTHLHVHATVAHLRLEPHIGGHLVEVQGPATINRDGHLGLELGGESR